MLLHKMAENISDFFARNQIIRVRQKAIYSYGIELLLSGICSVLGVCIISILLNDMMGYLLFLIGFVPFRLWAGGYHADSHVKCMGCFAVFYLTAYSLVRFAIILQSEIIGCLLSGIAFVLIWVLAPLGHPNKKLTKEKIIKNRFRSRWLAIVFCGVAVASYLLRIGNISVLQLLSGEFLAAISLVAGKIKMNRMVLSFQGIGKQYTMIFMLYPELMEVVRMRKD